MQYSCRKAQFDGAIQVGPPLHLSDLQRFSMRKGNPLAVRANGCTSPLCTLTSMVGLTKWLLFRLHPGIDIYEPLLSQLLWANAVYTNINLSREINIASISGQFLKQCYFEEFSVSSRGFFFSSILQSLIRMVLIVRNQLYCMKEYAFWI